MRHPARFQPFDLSAFLFNNTYLLNNLDYFNQQFLVSGKIIKEVRHLDRLTGEDKT